MTATCIEDLILMLDLRRSALGIETNQAAFPPHKAVSYSQKRFIVTVTDRNPGKASRQVPSHSPSRTRAFQILRHEPQPMLS